MCRVTAEPGLRWTQQRRAREAWAGRIALREPRALRGRAALSGSSRHSPMATCTTPSDPVAPTGRAYGKTVWSWRLSPFSDLLKDRKCLKTKAFPEFYWTNERPAEMRRAPIGPGFTIRRGCQWLTNQPLSPVRVGDGPAHGSRDIAGCVRSLCFLLGLFSHQFGKHFVHGLAF